MAKTETIGAKRKWMVVQPVKLEVEGMYLHSFERGELRDTITFSDNTGAKVKIVVESGEDFLRANFGVLSHDDD